MRVINTTTVVTGKPMERKEIAPGEGVDLPKTQAEDLVARGLAKWPEGEAAGSAASKPSGEALNAAILEAAEALDPEEDFGADGKPNAKALASVLGYKISAEERDAAWDSRADTGKLDV